MSRIDTDRGEHAKSARPASVRRVTMADVAAHANVDRAVVSKVLSNDPTLNIRDDTRQRVLQAVEALRYRPNAVARGLRTARAGAFGLVIPDFSNPAFTEIIAGAELAAARHRSVLLTSSAATFAVDQYVDLLEPGRVDGLLLTNIVLDAHTVERLQRLNVPWLILNYQDPDHQRYLILDDEHAAILAMQHLISLGHRRIAHLAGPKSNDTSRRRAGYFAALSDAGISHDPHLLVETTLTSAGGADAMRTLLTQPDPPTAVFIVNLTTAIGALSSARQLGWKIPNNLSAIAVHDLPLAAYLEPPLTTVRMPLSELGRRGIEILVTAPDTIAEVITSPIELVLRGSTGPPK